MIFMEATSDIIHFIIRVLIFEPDASSILVCLNGQRQLTCKYLKLSFSMLNLLLPGTFPKVVRPPYTQWIFVQ